MKDLIKQSVCVLVAILCYSCNNNSYRDMDLYYIQEDGKYGFVDSLGYKIIFPQYVCVSEFSNHLAAAVVDTFYDYRVDSTRYKLGLRDAREVSPKRYLNLRYGYINIENDFVIEPNLLRRFIIDDEEKIKSSVMKEITNSLSFSEGLAHFQDSITYKFGFIDTLGNKIIPAQYYSYMDFSEGKAAVEIFKFDKNHPYSISCFKWGFIDKQGQPKTDFIYQKLSSCVKGRAFGQIFTEARNQDKPDSILRHNENGELEYMKPNIDTNIPLQTTVTVLLDDNGNIIKSDLPSIYYYYNYTEDGVAIAELTHADIFGPDLKFVDINGNYLKPRRVHNNNPHFYDVAPEDYQFSDAIDMHEGFAGVMGSDGKWFFIDKNLNVYISPYQTAYDAIGIFSNGLAAVCINGKCGYINRNLDIVIPLKYDRANLAGKRLMRVYQINKDSHVVIESLINRKDSIVWQYVRDKGHKHK